MKKLILIIMLLPFFITAASADGPETEAAELTGAGAVEEALPDEEREISGPLRLDGGYDSSGALQRLWQHFLDKAEEGLREETGFVFSLLSIAVACALAAAICPEGNIPDYIHICGSCAAAYIISGSVEGLVSQALSALYSLSDYSRAAMPAVFTAAAACGAVGSSSVKYAAACLGIEVFMTAAQKLLIPLISAYIALSLSSAVFDNSILKAVSKLCKSICVLTMSTLCMVFSGYIGMSGLIAGSTDAMAVRTTKTVISNSLPVVGGIISDAASVVLASAALIKNSAGVFSLVAVAALCAGPFALLSVKMLLYKAVAAAADMLPGGKISGLLNSMGTAMALLLGLVGSCGIMLFISIMSAVRVINL